MSDLIDVKLIDGTARTIRELFTGRKYGIEYYQREYTWEESNVVELLDDLTTRFLDEYTEGDERDVISSYRYYFLGPIVTNLSRGIRYLVDGQQRLTTLTLLLIHLDHLAKNEDGAEGLEQLVYSQKFGSRTFNIDVDERQEVMFAILDGSSAFETLGKSESVRNIWERYQNIIEHFPEELKDEALVYFIDWLLERVVLVEIGTTDQDMALEVFETMNDRGLRLSNTDMLKGFLLSRIRDSQQIEKANNLWRTRITELSDLDKNADSDFLKHWLRGQYADTIRERKKGATSGDFDIIGTAFHKWVRDNTDRIELRNPGDYIRFINRDFERMSRRYKQLLHASWHRTPSLEHVFYNATVGITLQYLPILAAVTPEDDEETFLSKTGLIASFIDLFIARRMVNYRNYGYSTIFYNIFLLSKDIRNCDIDEVRKILADRVANLPDSFDAVKDFRLHGQNRWRIKYLLSRMTAWLESEVGAGNNFVDYMEWQQKNPYEVEHILPNKYELHLDIFDSQDDFDRYRNRFGALVLLPKSFNASYGANPYEKKVEHYYAQNLLAQSLHPRTYKNNPSFKGFVARTELPFKPYPDAFTKDHIEERQELYRRICEKIWDPDTLGLGGGVSKTPTKRTKKTMSTYDILGLELFGEYYKAEHKYPKYKVLQIVADEVYKRHSSDFHRALDIGGFVSEPSAQNPDEYYKIGASGVYVLNASGHFYKSYKLLELFGYKHEALRIDTSEGSINPSTLEVDDE